MPTYLRNAGNFSVDCTVTEGKCDVLRANFHFIDDPDELAAIALVQRKCGNVVITPDPVHASRASLYLTSCARMGDVVEQMFSGCLRAATPVAAPSPEMSVGQLHRRQVDLSYAWCQARVKAFAF